MGGRIRDDAIREVRERASLLEVVSDVVALRRRGRSATGLCPFHAEKTASFTVSEDRGFFHCFGCGEHGDVFTFVMKTESLSFPEAVRRVADRFGIALPEESGAGPRPGEPLASANALAAAFFRSALAGPAGAGARAYLVERGVSAESIERFGLGFAPGTGDALVRHLRAAQVRIEDALTAGLIVRRDRPDGSSALVDRFRDRLMFPITDPTGRKVIAFGGRFLPGRMPPKDPPPKYLNSPESPLFHKGQSLYGLAQARDAIRPGGRVIVVEGYLDVIALAQAGIGEVVAPLGTALTVDQLRLLQRRFDKAQIIACFDGDAAGRRAAARSFPVFLEAGLWGRGAFLPAGEDPDTFVRTQGREAMDACLTRAEPLVEAFLEDLAGPQRDAVGRKVEAAKAVAGLLKKVRNPLEFEVLASLSAQRLGVDEKLLRQEGTSDHQPKPAPVASRGASPVRHGEEELLVALLLADPSAATRISGAEVIEGFETPALRRAAEALLGPVAADPTTVVQELPRELRDHVVERLLGEVEEGDRERALADCVARIRDRRTRHLRGRLREELRAAESRGDDAAAEAVKRQLAGLMQRGQSQKVDTQE
jgi:DNA primase